MTTKKNLLAQIDKTNEQISDSPIIKGLVDGGLSLIPFVGTAISSSLDTRAFQLFEENSRKFADEVRRIITDLDENKLDKEFLESPEFTSLLIATLSRNAHTYQKEKIGVFAKIFVSFFTSPESKSSYKQGFIQIIDELVLQRKVRSENSQLSQFCLAMRAISNKISFLVIAYSI